MIIHIQSVPHRLKWVEEMILPHFKKSKCITHVDAGYTGPLNSYLEMLEHLKDEEYSYRLHLQDDVFLAIGLEDYLEDLKKEMSRQKIDVLTLFNANRKYMREAVKYQRRIVPYEGMFYGMCGVIFSKKADDAQRDYMGSYDNTIVDLLRDKKKKDQRLNWKQLRQADDLFVHHAIKDKGLKIYSHAPTLVEHNEMIDSAVGFKNNGTRNSGLFDVNFIKRSYGKEEN